MTSIKADTPLKTETGSKEAVAEAEAPAGDPNAETDNRFRGVKLVQGDGETQDQFGGAKLPRWSKSKQTDKPQLPGGRISRVQYLRGRPSGRVIRRNPLTLRRSQQLKKPVVKFGRRRRGIVLYDKKGFKAETLRDLSPEAKEMVKKWRSDTLSSGATQNIESIVSHSSFQQLSPSVQAAVLNSCARDPEAHASIAKIRELIQSEQFSAFKSAGQRNVLEFLDQRDSQWITDLSPDWRKEIIDHVGNSKKPSFDLTMGLVESSGFKALGLYQKGQLFNIVINTDVAGRGHLLDLVNRQGGDPPSTALLARDSQGNTLLENLHDIASEQKLADPRFIKPDVCADLLSSLCQELGKPGQINQGSKGTCKATSPLWEFAARDPAEVSRLARGLIVEGSVQMRRDGEVLKLDPGSIEKDSATTRSITERIMQSALMELANGEKLDYRNKEDQHYVVSTGEKAETEQGKDRRGLYDSEGERILEAFHDQDFDTLTSRKIGAREVLNKIRENTLGIVQASLRWRDVVVTEDDKTDRKHGYHGVAVTRVEDGRVYYRNPWGPKSDPDKTEYKQEGYPVRVLENRKTGEESMTVDEFVSRVTGAQIPHTPEEGFWARVKSWF